MNINIELADRSYDIILEKGCIARAADLLELNRKCIIVTDEGVPPEYAKLIADQCSEPVTVTIPQGEGSKSMAMLEKILLTMLDAGFTRSDCVIAVGGGVAGDLAGFAAATYMRGIDFYNIPTTLLSQADSSIGGKTAVNLGGVKNIAGAFWQPRRVLIDPDTLDTLPTRHKAAGLAEIIKAGLIADADLFGYIEGNIVSCDESGASGEMRSTTGDESGVSGEMRSTTGDKSGTSGERHRTTGDESGISVEKRNDPKAGSSIYGLDTLKIIEAALRVKKSVVEEDEREGGLRRILNYGHTIGHGIESVTELLHGECVAIGMIPMCPPEVRQRLIPVLRKAGLPVSADCEPDEVYKAIMHDKKMKDGAIKTVYVPEPGKAVIMTSAPEEIRGSIGSVCNY